MEILHCPSCGSDSIETDYFSAEYMSKTTYGCENCTWGFGNGSGIGTGSGNSGTHPRELTDDSSQSTLVETGEWCSTCSTCAKPGYCRCVEDDQLAFCEDCAKYSEHDHTEMWEVVTYFGRHSPKNRKVVFPCDLCGDKAELKVV